MAVSGSKNFELDVADYVEEAFERCGLELRTGYDLKTATRSLNLMLAEWANRGLNQWTITQKVLTLVIREPLGGVSTDVPMTRMSRSQYANISTKSTTGKPNQYLIDKQISPLIKIWPAPDQNSKYELYLNVLTRIDDADVGANTMEIPFRFFPCLAAGLAYYLALKRAPEKVGMLKQLYEEEFQRALSQDEDRASFRVAPDLRGYNIA